MTRYSVILPPKRFFVQRGTRWSAGELHCCTKMTSMHRILYPTRSKATKKKGEPGGSSSRGTFFCTRCCAFALFAKRTVQFHRRCMRSKLTGTVRALKQTVGERILTSKTVQTDTRDRCEGHPSLREISSQNTPHTCIQAMTCTRTKPRSMLRSPIHSGDTDLP